jgi:hypothetical protein
MRTLYGTSTYMEECSAFPDGVLPVEKRNGHWIHGDVGRCPAEAVRKHDEFCSLPSEKFDRCGCFIVTFEAP